MPKHLEFDEELKEIVKMDEMKVILWFIIAIPVIVLYTVYFPQKSAFYYNLFSILLILASYLTGALLMHLEKKQHPLGRKHSNKRNRKKKKK